MKRLLLFFGEFVIIILGALVVGAVFYHALAHARSIIEFELCHLPTSQPKGPFDLAGTQIKGSAPVFADQVMMVIPLANGKCTQIVMLGREQAFVVGDYKTVICRLNGGQNCEHKEAEERSP